MTSLVAQLFASHGAGWPAPGRTVRLRVDHVLLDEQDGVPALLAFEALGRARLGCELALVAPAREAEGPDALDDLRYLRTAASAFGATFARPGAGPPATTYRRAFARPGRTLLASTPGAAGAGAFGTLVLAAEPTTLAVALAGEALLIERPRAIAVRLQGAPPAGAGGAEIAGSLASALGDSVRDAVVEFSGDALASLPVATRVEIATLAPAVLGALAALFPSDDRLRARLAASGRDADWRRLEGGEGEADGTLEFDLARVRTRAGEPTDVRIGPLADDDELRELAARAWPGTSLAHWEIVPGGRAARAPRAAGAALEALEAAGARRLDPAGPLALAPPARGAWVCGEDPALAGDTTTVVSCAALLALLPAATHAPGEPARAALDPAELLPPAPAGGAAVDRGAAHVVPVPPPPLEGSPRGTVRWASGRDVPTGRILARGPRAQARRGDAAALAALAFRPDEEAPPDPGTGPGVALGAGRWGEGPEHDAAARALAALGLRAVIAAGFAPAHARALADHGVLPLVWCRAGDAALLERGDELEFPGIAEGIGAAGRVAVRSLTRGLTVHVAPALSPEWMARAGAGGVLASLALAATER